MSKSGTVVGPPASAAVRADAGVAAGGLLDVFERAFASGVGLGFEYTDRQGKVSARRIEPHGLLVQPPVWYVLGRDADNRRPRMFRMDRVRRPRLLPSLQFRPDTAVIDALLPEGFDWQPLAAS